MLLRSRSDSFEGECSVRFCSFGFLFFMKKKIYI